MVFQFEKFTLPIGKSEFWIDLPLILILVLCWYLLSFHYCVFARLERGVFLSSWLYNLQTSIAFFASFSYLFFCTNQHVLLLMERFDTTAVVIDWPSATPRQSISKFVLLGNLLFLISRSTQRPVYKYLYTAWIQVGRDNKKLPKPANGQLHDQVHKRYVILPKGGTYLKLKNKLNNRTKLLNKVFLFFSIA